MISLVTDLRDLHNEVKHKTQQQHAQAKMSHSLQLYELSQSNSGDRVAHCPC